MTWHLHGSILTCHGTAANNRGENAGNITQLQKLLWKGSVHTTVSAEAIRWALRYWWQLHSREKPELQTNRQWDDQTDNNKWQDEKWKGWAEKDGKTYIDDDVLGFRRPRGPRAMVPTDRQPVSKAQGKFSPIKMPKPTVPTRSPPVGPRGLSSSGAEHSRSHGPSLSCPSLAT